MKYLSLVMIAAGLLMAVVVVGLTAQQGRIPQNPHGKLRWDCQDCHTTESWSEVRSPMRFDHDETGFHLTGSHQTASCVGCHKDLTFAHVGTACIDCHADHHGGRLGLDCASCHTPRDWQNRKNVLEIHAQQGFPLAGVHAVADCEACHPEHPNQQYSGTPMDCFSCHAEEFQLTTDPDHEAVGFSRDCENCHHAALGSWQTSDFIHPASFPLTGAHKQASCSQCHTGDFTGAPTACFDCHGVEFAATTDPDHEQGGISHECAICHTTTAWQPARYDHDATAFPLTGGHRTTPCLSCHATGYAGTPTDCIACHRADYDATTDPDHMAAGFPTTCEGCHSTAGWGGTTWDHDGQYFPIYSGAHRGRWDACTECHVNPSSFATFECITCHEHNQTEMDDKHRNVDNYAYVSTACYECHPRGRH